MKIRIASLLLSSWLLLACAWPASSAASPLLSGYGGPGAGEQAVIGATLLNGASGAGSASGAERLSGVAGREGSAAQAPGPGGESLAAGGAAGSSRAGAVSGAAGGGPAGSAERGRGGRSGHGFVYPSALRSPSSAPALGLSTGDWLALAAGVVGLIAVGAITVRIARLER